MESDALLTSRKILTPSGLMLMGSITGIGKFSMGGTELKSSLTKTEEKQSFNNSWCIRDQSFSL